MNETTKTTLRRHGISIEEVQNSPKAGLLCLTWQVWHEGYCQNVNSPQNTVYHCIRDVFLSMARRDGIKNPERLVPPEIERKAS